MKMNAKINNNKSSDKKRSLNAFKQVFLKTVNNNNISVGFNLQYSLNEGIKH